MLAQGKNDFLRISVLQYHESLKNEQNLTTYCDPLACNILVDLLQLF